MTALVFYIIFDEQMRLCVGIIIGAILWRNEIKKSERIVVDFCNSCYTIHSVLHRMYLRYKKGREVQWDFDKLPEKDFIFYSSGRFLGF